MATVRPTDDELQSAFLKAKQPPHNLRSTQIKHTDHGAGIVRHYLPPNYHSWPLDEVRIACETLSKAGKEPGKKKRTPEQRQAAGINSLLKAFPINGEHSHEYDRIHSCQDYKDLRDARKRAIGYRCQLCTRVFLGAQLEGHILDYENWNKPGMMLILCRDECHPIADSLRRRGKHIEKGEEVLPLLLF